MLQHTERKRFKVDISGKCHDNQEDLVYTHRELKWKYLVNVVTNKKIESPGIDF